MVAPPFILDFPLLLLKEDQGEKGDSPTHTHNTIKELILYRILFFIYFIFHLISSIPSEFRISPYLFPIFKIGSMQKRKEGLLSFPWYPSSPISISILVSSSIDSFHDPCLSLSRNANFPFFSNFHLCVDISNVTLLQKKANIISLVGL